MHAALTDIPNPGDTDSLNVWLQALPDVLKQTVGATCTFDQIKLVKETVAAHPVDYQKLILHTENLRRTPQLAKQPITAENKDTYRPFLQWLGGYMVQKIDPGIWWYEILRRIQASADNGCRLCIVGGLRFPTDATILRTAGAKIVKVYRPGHLQNDMLDPTERERDKIQVDCTIVSKGTVENVKATAAKFLQDLRQNQLQETYQAKNH